jgi:hypothetical protein
MSIDIDIYIYIESGLGLLGLGSEMVGFGPQNPASDTSPSRALLTAERSRALVNRYITSCILVLWSSLRAECVCTPDDRSCACKQAGVAELSATRNVISLTRHC